MTFHNAQVPLSLVLLISLQISITILGSQNPYGNYPPQYPPQGSHDSYGQRQQQQQQQQNPPQYSQGYGSNAQQPQKQAPQQYQPSPQQQSPMYNSLTPFSRGPPVLQNGRPQVQQPEGGFFSKLKSGIAAAGSVFAGGNAQPPPPPRRPLAPPPFMHGTRPAPPGSITRPGQQGPPPPRGSPASGYGSYSPPHSQSSDEPGLFGRIKGLLGMEVDPDDEPTGPRRPPSQPAPQGYPQRPAGPPGQYPGYPQHSQPPPPPRDQYAPPPHAGPPPGYPQYSQEVPPLPPQPLPQGEPYPQYPPEVQPPQQEYGQYGSPPQPQTFGYSAYDAPQPASPPPPPPELLIPPEPQVFVEDDCIVMVLRPREFYRKKQEISAGGAAGLQVFTSFENALTRFKTQAAPGLDAEEALTTAEVLLESRALAPQAIAQLRQLSEELRRAAASTEDGAGIGELEDNYAARHAIIAREGALHIAAVPGIARELMHQAPLREGLRDCLQTLSFRGVPVYVFSSGFGDVAAQLLIQSGAVDGGALPQNLRIISNFFRTTPDGTVRGFSSPLVHDRNMNASTAAAHMGMPVPDRPFGLVLGSDVHDLGMTDGTAVQMQLSVGYLRLSEDLPAKLSSFLQSFDAVVLGDGSLKYIQGLLDNLLQGGAGPASASGPGWAGSREEKRDQRSFMDYDF